MRERGWMKCSPCAYGNHAGPVCATFSPGRAGWDYPVDGYHTAVCRACGYGKEDHGNP